MTTSHLENSDDIILRCRIFVAALLRVAKRRDGSDWIYWINKKIL